MLPALRIRVDDEPWRELRAVRIVLGSSPRADVVIRGASRHARLEADDEGAVMAIDLGGGLTVDHVRVAAAWLPSEATLALGGCKISVELGEPWEIEPRALEGLDAIGPRRRAALAAIATLDGRAPIALEGEPGVGKRTAARLLHDRLRPGGPLVIVDCRARLDALEPRLFGDAMGHPGRASAAFAEARGGTLVLEELAALDPALWSRLRRALDREDALVIATSTADLDRRSNQDLPGDLLDRFDRAYIPSLRACPEDLHGLARRFAGDLDDEAWGDLERALGARRWRGNVAELAWFVARTRALAER